MSKTLRITLIVVLVPVALALLVGVVFASERLTNGGQVLGRVTVADVQLGGLSEGDALAAVRNLEWRMAAAPVPVSVAGHHFSLDPKAVSFTIDEHAVVAEAMQNGRQGNVAGQFGWWATHLNGGHVQLSIPYSYDATALAAIVADWEVNGVSDPPDPGDVTVRDGQVSFRYPATGVGIEQDEAVVLLGTALGDPTRAEVDLSSRVLQPPLTDADIDAAVAEARSLLDGDVTLESEPVVAQLVIPSAALGQSLEVTRDDTTSPPTFVFSWNPAPLQEVLLPHMAELSTEPVNAELLIDDTTDEITIQPSIATQEPDPDALPEAVNAAARATPRTAALPYREGAQPEVTTADIEALGITGLIGSFTTHHHCCEARVTNIHLIAEATDGALIMPGEVFDLNEYVGQRTTAKGYVPAPAIIKGSLECCDDPANIGGGTSQFTTTLYNAAFFAGLEIIDHQPHTEPISRYPEGREATLGWTQPNLVFRNDTDHAIIIKTLYDGTSVTAKIYGDNGGRVVHAGFEEDTPVSDEVAYDIPSWNAAAAHYRYNYSGIITRYEDNPDLACGTEQTKSEGSGGWSIDVYRFITYPDGTEVTQKTTWHYSGLYKVVERGPACPPTP
jgi:hypothetical protein